MGIFARGQKLWVRYKDEKGRWINRPTGYSVGEEAKAARFLTRISELSARARLQDRASTHATAQANDPLRLAVAQYIERWLSERKELGLASWSDDAARLRRHVAPASKPMI